MYKIINADCRKQLKSKLQELAGRNVVIISDPPFNVGYHYGEYKDNLPQEEYDAMMRDIFGSGVPSVVIHYPEALYRIAIGIGQAPKRVVSWIYNSNTPRQHRDICFFGIEPDFTKVKQPYKNLNDKRIKNLMAEEGNGGARLYDWWEVNQVKNVSKDKTEHSCQMPLEVMDYIIRILPKDIVVIDPFCGSGTTGVACAKNGVDFIGYDIDPMYCKIAENRIEDELNRLDNMF